MHSSERLLDEAVQHGIASLVILVALLLVWEAISILCDWVMRLGWSEAKENSKSIRGERILEQSTADSNLSSKISPTAVLFNNSSVSGFRDEKIRSATTLATDLKAVFDNNHNGTIDDELLKLFECNKLRCFSALTLAYMRNGTLAELMKTRESQDAYLTILKKTVVDVNDQLREALVLNGNNEHRIKKLDVELKKVRTANRQLGLQHEEDQGTISELQRELEQAENADSHLAEQRKIQLDLMQTVFADLKTTREERDTLQQKYIESLTHLTDLRDRLGLADAQLLEEQVKSKAAAKSEDEAWLTAYTAKGNQEKAMESERDLYKQVAEANSDSRVGMQLARYKREAADVTRLRKENERLAKFEAQWKSAASRLSQEASKAQDLQSEVGRLTKEEGAFNKLKHENQQLKKKLSSSYASSLQEELYKVKAELASTKAVSIIISNRESSAIPPMQPVANPENTTQTTFTIPGTKDGTSFEIQALRLLRYISKTNASMLTRANRVENRTGLGWGAYCVVENLLDWMKNDIDAAIKKVVRLKNDGEERKMVLDEGGFPALGKRKGK